MGEMSTKYEIEILKSGIREVLFYIDEHTGTVNNPKTMSMDETIEVFQKLTKLLNA